MSILQLHQKAADDTHEEAAASRGPGLVAIVTVFTGMSVVFVGARIVRCAQIRKFNLEDLLVVVSLLASITLTAVFGYSVHLGYGGHQWDITPEHVMPILRLAWISDPIANWGFMTSKLAVGVTLLRLGFGRTFQILIAVTMLIAVLFNMWPFTAQLVGCNQFKYWVHTDLKCTPGSELTLVSLLYIQSAGNIAADFAYVVLLEVYIRRVKLSSRDRFAVRVVLLFMLTATVSCVAKTCLFHSIFADNDSTYAGVPTANLSVVELNLALSAACLPALRLLLGRYFPKHIIFWKPTTHDYGSNTDGYTGRLTGRTGGTQRTMRSQINKTETVQIDEEVATAGHTATELTDFGAKTSEEGKSSRAIVYEVKATASSSPL